jgi:hypothetical protein
MEDKNENDDIRCSPVSVDKCLRIAEAFEDAAAIETVGRAGRRLPIGSAKLAAAALRKYADTAFAARSSAGIEDADTIQTLLDLLNPLHGELDRQTYDEKVAQNFDAPRDAEYSVNITAQMERDLTQAMMILENRKRSPALAQPSQEQK